ncbi:MAG TPA: 3D domain-containing protein [Kiritimatiellia bacterium]|nr:MAG: Cell wall-binding protein YocH precursor [Verrucomicrobia bacterium ADurb.Bin070]HPB11371.1 3D domain-containing protein [Kiritimatiellia bacterium]HQA38786.1 3D domain-containing protein [Kiritimatiellia bacterium]HQQ91746.1 3D domain-containing protein [Kiritimatiellia bacterium]
MSTLPHRRARCAWIDRIPAALAGLCLPVLVWWAGCMTERIRPPGGRTPVVMTMEVTGYCNCGICCSWERSWFGLGAPVISSGPNKGKPKEVGVTASGTRARHGTLAADTSVLPFGTVVEVPGYGFGRVEDRGGAIKGNRLDLWFPSHGEAQQWGRQKGLRVRVWKP